jgi:hypothetical protein
MRSYLLYLCALGAFLSHVLHGLIIDTTPGGFYQDKYLTITWCPTFSGNNAARGGVSFKHGFIPICSYFQPVRLALDPLVTGTVDLRRGSILLDGDIWLGDASILGAPDAYSVNWRLRPKFARFFPDFNPDGCGAIELNGNTLHLTHNLTLTSGVLVLDGHYTGTNSWISSISGGVLDGHGHSIVFKGGILNTIGTQNNLAVPNKTIIFRNLVLEDVDDGSFNTAYGTNVVFENVTFKFANNSPIIVGIDSDSGLTIRGIVRFEGVNTLIEFAEANLLIATQSQLYIGPSVALIASNRSVLFEDQSSELFFDNSTFVVGPGDSSFTIGNVTINGNVLFDGVPLSLFIPASVLSLGDGVASANNINLVILPGSTMKLGAPNSNLIVRYKNV